MAAISAGTAIALTSVAAGLGVGASKVQANAAERAQDKVARTIASNKLPEPKVIPTINQDKVQQGRLSALSSLQARTGRASTLLTSQSGQNNTFG